MSERPLNKTGKEAALLRNRILILQTGFLGDVILATALFEPLSQEGYELFLTVRPEHKSLFEHDPLIAGIIPDDKRHSRKGLFGLLQTAKELRRYRFAIALTPHRSHRTAILLALAGIPRRIGFASCPMSWLLTDAVKIPEGIHQIERNIKLLKPLELEPVAPKLRLCLPPHACRAAKTLLAEARGALVGVAPGSAWPTKRWLPSKFAGTLEYLRRMVDFTAVILGGDSERKLASQIASCFAGPLIDLTGKTDLQTFCAVVAELDVLISNDSAPVHIAGAFMVPTVTVFLATHPNFGFGPMLQPYRVMQVNDLACRPCSKHGSSHCPRGDFACAYRLSEEEVAIAAEELIRQSRCN